MYIFILFFFSLWKPEYSREKILGDYHYRSMTEDANTDIIVSTSDINPWQRKIDIWDQIKVKDTLRHGVSSFKFVNLRLNIWKL